MSSSEHPDSRPHLIRKDRYNEALKLVKRVHELKDEHGWTEAQFRKAMDSMGEAGAYFLHWVGASKLHEPL